ncbi:glycerophosphodiester phosphodiesterase [Thalassobacillus hwangdonensis]|uniref:Glycerophosphodiester phosphodiesterase n=1 Tax=Thalassobacillus hwangdonensis TaxID=546108 RepID=A0ABW3L080_9BACI
MIYAHRGASKLAPENTMPAFELAFHAGADGIETDVQLTKDGVPVLIHDETVRRTSNGTGFVQDHTLEDIKKLDFGSWFSSKFSDTPIVTLEQFLVWVKGKNLKINVELKTDKIPYEGIEQKVYDLLLNYELLGDTVISSFNLDSIKAFHDIDPKVETAFLTSKNRNDLTTYAKSQGASCLHLKYRLINKTTMKAARKAKMPVRTYTVNRPMQFKKCFKMKCAGIFTDVPHLAIEYREMFS